LPAKAASDALHMALAAANGMDFLLTWNCTHEDLHFVKIGTSNSSERQAAYASASMMSSGSRYGYKRRISSCVWPEARSPTTVPTVTRIPRMHGLPPIIAGSAVIRVSVRMLFGVYEQIGVRAKDTDRFSTARI